MAKAIKIIVWDKTNNLSLGEFSNPPLGMQLDIDLENREMRLGSKAYNMCCCDLAPGDIIELRISEGIEM